MPFPASMIRNWTQHRVFVDRVCARCGLTGIPSLSIHEDGAAYEKEGRFHLGTPEKFLPCEEKVS